MPRYGSIKQRKLLILFRMGNLPVGGGFLSRELPGQKLLFQPHVIHHFSLAGEYSKEIHDILIHGTNKSVKVRYKGQRGEGVYDIVFEGLLL